MSKTVSLQTPQEARVRYDYIMMNETMTADSLADLVAAELLLVEGNGGWDEDDLDDGVMVLGFIEDQGALTQWEELATEGNVFGAVELALSL